MKLSQMVAYTTPFVDTDILSIKAKKHEGYITEYVVHLKGPDVKKTFPCNGKPDVAWIEMEKYIHKSKVLDNVASKIIKKAKLSNKEISKRLKSK